MRPACGTAGRCAHVARGGGSHSPDPLPEFVTRLHARTSCSRNPGRKRSRRPIDDDSRRRAFASNGQMPSSVLTSSSPTAPQITHRTANHHRARPAALPRQPRRPTLPSPPPTAVLDWPLGHPSKPTNNQIFPASPAPPTPDPSSFLLAGCRRLRLVLGRGLVGNPGPRFARPSTAVCGLGTVRRRLLPSQPKSNDPDFIFKRLRASTTKLLKSSLYVREDSPGSDLIKS